MASVCSGLVGFGRGQKANRIRSSPPLPRQRRLGRNRQTKNESNNNNNNNLSDSSACQQVRDSPPFRHQQQHQQHQQHQQQHQQQQQQQRPTADSLPRRRPLGALATPPLGPSRIASCDKNRITNGNPPDGRQKTNTSPWPPTPWTPTPWTPTPGHRPPPTCSVAPRSDSSFASLSEFCRLAKRGATLRAQNGSSSGFNQVVTTRKSTKNPLSPGKAQENQTETRRN